MVFNPKIIRSRRRTLTIQILPDASVLVKAPLFTPTFIINSFINKNGNWIEQKILELIQKKDKNKLNYKEGANLLFLGNEYTITFVNDTKISLKIDRILVPEAGKFRLEKELNIWLVRQARDIITKQVEYYASLMKARYTDLKFSDTRSQWGRCTYENKLQFSWRLIMAPILVINYVVVHELSHTFEKNHSRVFWNKVRLYNPTYRQQIKWLNDNGHSLKD